MQIRLDCIDVCLIGQQGLGHKLLLCNIIILSHFVVRFDKNDLFGSKKIHDKRAKIMSNRLL